MRDVPPPLVGFLLYHRSMREGARLLAAALRRQPGEAELAATADWFARFRYACLIHADAEDTVLWPALAAARADLGALIDGMDGEHAELQHLLEAIADALTDPARTSEAAAAAERLEELIARHLDSEEATVVPALVEALGPQLEDLMARVQQSAGPEGTSVAVPFLLAHATDEERAAVLAAMPPPVRNSYESVWRDEYAALTAAVP